MAFRLKYTNLVGLLALLGTVAGLIGTGILYPVSPLAALPFVLLAIGSFILFVLFVYHFVFHSPIGEVPDDEARAFYREDE